MGYERATKIWTPSSQHANHTSHIQASTASCKASESKAHADSLARKLLMKDTKSFWAEIKRLNGKLSTPIASTIGKSTGPHAIAEQWKNHYSSILNSVAPGRRYKGITEFLESTTFFFFFFFFFVKLGFYLVYPLSDKRTLFLCYDVP